MARSAHISVMRDEAVGALRARAGGLYIDGTFGAGGYTRALLESEGGAKVIAIDRDPAARKTADSFSEEFGPRFEFFAGPFSHIEKAANGRPIDGIVLDIGVSSMQIDQAERGFSFMRSGPLDMRMASEGLTAADAVNHFDHEDLIRIFKAYGEERRARRCADFIVRAREVEPFETTEQLADTIASALGKGGKIHPATRVFQALRIYINDELGELYRALIAAETVLAPGGYLSVVSFHSLEDKIVKAFLRRRAGETSGRSRYLPPDESAVIAPSFTLGNRSARKPKADEIDGNARSRSAKLRVATRTDAAIWSDEESLLPRAPSLDDLAANIRRTGRAR
ncbi:MAG: 16S rRNA (cytosine(1402)-N(4))-methyltransferase RsmH [Robiginitomaculum sp.]